jgi:hypothetical protein
MVHPVPGFIKLNFPVNVRIGTAWESGNSARFRNGNRTGKMPSLQIFVVS